MNRLLLVPCFASCLGFVFVASSPSVEMGGASVKGSECAVCAVAEARVLLSAEQLEEDLLARWNRYNESKYTFSRVYRPQRFQKPGILVDATLPAPEGSFVGVFTLQEQRPELLQALAGDEVKQNELPELEFPIVVDRRTSQAMVFAAGQWVEFDQWAVKKM